MATMKCILGLLALLAVSAWTEARVVNGASGGEGDDAEGDLTVTEQLEKANKNLTGRDGIQINGDIAVSTLSNGDPRLLNALKWPKDNDGIVYVPYVIAPDYTSQQQDLIERGLRSFDNATCIRFLPRTKQRDYLNIQSLDGCNSYIGRQGNGQTVSLNRDGCIQHGVIQHELLHALGINHEHVRSDRDDYIRVLRENIIEGKEGNFEKISTLKPGTPYDYNSVMHYGRLAFSKNNNPTLVAVPNSNAVFGTATMMSQNDINQTNLLYCSSYAVLPLMPLTVHFTVLLYFMLPF